MKMFLNTIIFITASLVYLGCAKPGSLSGGPKDTTPPKMILEKSTPNFQTNFYPKQIKLYFDEWINIKKKDQILISPPTENRVDISYKGKHVIIEFNEKDTLKENTTYTINFGKSIVDFTEGNPVSDLVYIFSTGNKIDSLEIQGKVISSFDKKPMKDITVMLYDSEEDSIVVNSKPYYFANTDKSGRFKISYIKQGKFKVFALKDENANYLYDLETEEIGYIDTMVIIQDDTIIQNLTIELFAPTPKLRIVEKSIAAYGKLKIEYNRKPDSIKIIDSSTDILYKEIINDSLIIWFNKKTAGRDSINLVIKNEDQIDSLLFKNRRGFINPLKLNMLKSVKTISLHPEKPVSLEFNQQFVLADTTKISLYERIFNKIEDTSKTVMFDTIIKNLNFISDIDSLNKRRFIIRSKWEEEKKYILTILPGYFTTNFNTTNDTIEIKISIDKKESYSNLVCHIDSLKNDQSYILLLKQKKEIINKKIVIGKVAMDIDFSALKPGKYTLEIIEDANKNNRWDGGDYFKKLKAEKRYIFNLNELKANWNQEEDIILKTNRINDTKK